MIALVQRVSCARVEIAGDIVGRIDAGILALVGVERGDAEEHAVRLAERVLGYRMFPDQDGKMNRCLAEVQGSLLAVPQFTLAADTRKGARPSFSSAAAPEDGVQFFDRFVVHARTQGARVETGRFGASMQVHLVNDGPVTFWLRVPPREDSA